MCRHRGCKRVSPGLHLPSASETAGQVEGQEVDAVEGSAVSFTFGKKPCGCRPMYRDIRSQAGGNRSRKQ